MNQILDYNPISNGDNRGNRGNGGTDKIVKAFAFLLIIFALCLIGIGIYNKIQNSSTENQETVTETKANIVTAQDGENLIITVTHDKKLTKLIYNWNTSLEKTLAIDTGNTFETSIKLPTGDNTLNIQVVDEKGNKTEYSEEITSEEGVDIIKPTIADLKNSVTEDVKLLIKAKDETAISYITYRWNDEEEVTVKAEEEDQLQITSEIEIREGTNTLTVIAVDKANNTASVQDTFVTQMKPKIQVLLSEDKSKLVITCTHENGVSKIEYTLNGKPFAADLADNPKEVQFEQKLDEGNNVIMLTVTSVDNTSTTFGGQCTYTPENQVTIE